MKATNKTPWSIGMQDMQFLNGALPIQPLGGGGGGGACSKIIIQK